MVFGLVCASFLIASIYYAFLYFEANSYLKNILLEITVGEALGSEHLSALTDYVHQRASHEETTAILNAANPLLLVLKAPPN
tara:strand:+ start:875 stop:1120 length:246 start_codon:yes stop_codon:yes gene_type:complete